MLNFTRQLRNMNEEEFEQYASSACGRDPVAAMMLRARYEAANAVNPCSIGATFTRAPEIDTEHPGFWYGRRHYSAQGVLLSS